MMHCNSASAARVQGMCSRRTLVLWGAICAKIKIPSGIYFHSSNLQISRWKLLKSPLGGHIDGEIC